MSRKLVAISRFPEPFADRNRYDLFFVDTDKDITPLSDDPFYAGANDMSTFYTYTLIEEDEFLKEWRYQIDAMLSGNP